MTASMHIRLEKEEYRPDESVAGAVEWAHAERSSILRLRLAWVLVGPTGEQVGIVEELQFPLISDAGAQQFHFVLPEGPWSFGGFYLYLRWIVEATLLPSGMNAVQDFMLSPDGKGTRVLEPKKEG
jgi:hypothetical protein